MVYRRLGFFLYVSVTLSASTAGTAISRAVAACAGCGNVVAGSRIALDLSVAVAGVAVTVASAGEAIKL